MALTKYSLGQLLELTTETNSNLVYGPDDVRGMTISKQIIPTKADVSTTDLNKFLVVHPNEFVFNPRTHGKKIGFGFNDTNETFLISWNNIAFRIKEEASDTVLPEYLFLHFNRSEWDREACFRSWGSSTEVFTWDALCEMELELPDIPTQQKYVDIYLSMVANQQSYERGVEDLKLACEGFIDKMRKIYPHQKIEPYIELVERTNLTNCFGKDDVRGVNNSKQMIMTKADINGRDLSKFSIVLPGEFVFNHRTSRNGGKFSITINNDDIPHIFTEDYVVFKVKDECIGVVDANWLYMLFCRSEFDRYVIMNSWGSSTEFYNWEDIQEVKFPIPEIYKQKAATELFTVYLQRRKINEQLKEQIRDICPILIKGSLEEGK